MGGVQTSGLNLSLCFPTPWCSASGGYSAERQRSYQGRRWEVGSGGVWGKDGNGREAEGGIQLLSGRKVVRRRRGKDRRTIGMPRSDGRSEQGMQRGGRPGERGRQGAGRMMRLDEDREGSAGGRMASGREGLCWKIAKEGRGSVR